MISAKELPQATPQYVNTLRPIHDTHNGEPVTIPTGYRVKIVSENPYIVECFVNATLGKIKVTADHDDLFAPLPIEEVVQQVIDNLDQESEVEFDPYPLIPRIYQEFGITWLIWKKRGILADAPGVGKTVQGTEAASRIMQAYKSNKDPLAYCYNRPFNMHRDLYSDQLETNSEQPNPHPTSHPRWAIPGNTWPELISSTWHKPVTVIAAPNHLCDMWFKHIRKQYPNDAVALCTNDTKQNRFDALLPGCSWYIINHEMLRPAPEPDEEEDYEWVTVPRVVQGVTYNFKERQLKSTYVKPVTYSDKIRVLKPICIILDECHRFKSSKSKQAREAHAVAKDIPYCFLMSATPIKREADDLFWQLHIVDESMFGHEEAFMREYTYFEQTQYGKRDVQLRTPAKRFFWVNRVDANKDASDYFSQLTSTATSNKNYNVNFEHPNLKGWILGRSYKDVGIYLPETISATIPVLLETKTRDIYESCKSAYKAAFADLEEEVELNSMIAVLHTLRSITAASQNKLEAVQQLIEDNPGPHLIFTEYDEQSAFLAKKLGLTEAITGHVPPAERMPKILELIRQEKPIVATGRSVGTGVNGMESVKTVIFYEEDWTPGEMYQRISRVQRFDPNLKQGETKDPILVFYVHCTNTIDEKVHEIQKNRSASIKDVIKVELAS